MSTAHTLAKALRMMLTKAVPLLCTCLIFELVASGLSAPDANTQTDCPLSICTHLLKGAAVMESRLKDLESRLAESEAQIEELKRASRDMPKVAFSASSGSNGFFGPVDKDTTLVYKNVYINVGDSYNRDTGIFTAPVRGVYYFSFFYHCSVEHGTGLDLYKNGKQQALALHNRSNGSPKNGGNGLTLLLEKGDRVSIVLRKDHWVWDSVTSSVTMFTGFLINAM